MLSPARSRLQSLCGRHIRTSLLRPYSTADRTSDRIPTNDPDPPKPVQNVSGTNALPTSSGGNRDAPLQEMPEDSERQRTMQAPNRKGVWSRSQAPREVAMSGPRFEQTIMEHQVRGVLPGSGFGKAVRDVGNGLILYGRFSRNRGLRLILYTNNRFGGRRIEWYLAMVVGDRWVIRESSSTSTNRRSVGAHIAAFHSKALEALPSTSYPLKPLGDPAEVPESQRVSDEPFGQR
ncbi:MAG: hypothetical protein M1830_005787 [Pleopsidium flavum]|nr:MAG: hypothetical protein M1830_005787 [Pleopsidium flavum]